MPHETSRRSLLAGLSAAPAVVMASALPSAVLAHPAVPAAHVDADLIAQAARVTRLSRLSDRAGARASRRSDAAMLARGPRPVAPDSWGGSCTLEEHPVDLASDIERSFTMTVRKPPAEHQEARRRHAEALAAYEAEKARLSAVYGVEEADELASQIWDEVEEAAIELAGMAPTTLDGLAAKASAVLALEGGNEWIEDLAQSLAHDVVRIGRSVA